MSDIRVAILSDIHGNRRALEAVLEDIRRRGIQNIVNLGDSLYGPLDPGGTADLLLDLDIPTVRGNEDRILLEPPARAGDPRIIRYVLGLIAVDHKKWLESLPVSTVAFEDLFLCHGTPEKDDEYLLMEVTEKGTKPKGIDALSAELSSVVQDVILCGHDHVPRTVHLPGGKLAVDPGSVGLPSYADDLPLPHAMETGSPHARYAVAEKYGTEWNIEHPVVPYDWDSAAADAMNRGFGDWAGWIATGRAKAD